MVCPPAAAISRGGLWIQVQKTMGYLRSRGFEVTTFEASDTISLRSYDLCHVMGANIGTFHSVRELHRKGMPLVVSPVFFSLHSAGFLRSALAMQGFINRFVHGLWTDYGFIADLCRWARVVVPNTQAEARLLSGGFLVEEEKIIVIPNGVDDRFYLARPNAFRERYGLQGFILNVGYFGMARKNTLRLIRTLGHIDVPAVIIGQAEDPQYFEHCRREAKGNPRILLIDALPHDSELLASAYASCDVFVLPSLFETPGIAALEAALAGAKIVITKYGGTEEYFGQWAEYIEPRSDESVASGLRAALERPKTTDLREHVRKNFLWTNIGEKTVGVYEKVLS